MLLLRPSRIIFRFSDSTIHEAKGGSGRGEGEGNGRREGRQGNGDCQNEGATGEEPGLSGPAGRDECSTYARRGK